MERTPVRGDAPAVRGDDPVARDGDGHDPDRAGKVRRAVLQRIGRLRPAAIAARGRRRDLEQPMPPAVAARHVGPPRALVLGERGKKPDPEGLALDFGRGLVPRTPGLDIFGDEVDERPAVRGQRGDRGLGPLLALGPEVPPRDGNLGALAPGLHGGAGGGKNEGEKRGGAKGRKTHRTSLGAAPDPVRQGLPATDWPGWQFPSRPSAGTRPSRPPPPSPSPSRSPSQTGTFSGTSSGRSCTPSSTSSMIFAVKASRSPGLRLVTMPFETTTSRSTQVAPAFFTSVRIEW